MLQTDDAHAIHYEAIGGDDTRPCLVFLHEGLGCAAMWKDFPQRLCRATDCPGLVYDRLGYGRSSPLTGTRTVHYLHTYALDELPIILAQRVAPRDYILIGHSDGGSIGLMHAAEKPARLLGLITEAAHVFVEQETVEGIRVAQNAFAAGKLAGLAKYHGEKTDGIFRAWSDTWLSTWFTSWNIEYLLPSIDCPVLVLQGVEDQYGTVAQVDTIVAKAVQAEKRWWRTVATRPIRSSRTSCCS